MTSTDEIRNVISRIRVETFRGIGTPVIEIPIDQAAVIMRDGRPVLYISMIHAVELAESILDHLPLTSADRDIAK